MKKLTSLLLIAAILTSLLSLSSCGNDEPELEEPQYETITLTKSNYSDYIIFNSYFTDQRSSSSNEKYNLSGTQHIEVSAANEDYRFEKVTITFGSIVAASPILDSLSITINLNAYGEAHGTGSYSIKGAKDDEIDQALSKVTLKSITGTVRVPVK